MIVHVDVSFIRPSLGHVSKWGVSLDIKKSQNHRPLKKLTTFQIEIPGTESIKNRLNTKSLETTKYKAQNFAYNFETEIIQSYKSHQLSTENNG